MSELVLAKATAPVALGKLTKKPKHSSSLLSVPERYLRTPASKDSHFQETVDMSWLQKRFDSIETGQFGLIMADIFIGGTSAFVTGMTTGAWALVGGTLAAAQVLWVVPGLVWMPAYKAKRRNFQIFLNWMQERYGVTINAPQGLPNFLVHLTSSPSHTFADDKGQVLALNRYEGNVYGLTYGEGPNKGAEYPLTAAAKVPQLKKQLEVTLPKDLQEAQAEVERLIAMLGQRDLSPESDHEKVLALYSDLHGLGAVTDAHRENIDRVLNQLRVELTGVLQREAEWALNALTVETTYVTSREERPGFKITKEKA
jgi:hypothetical protein